MEEIINGSINAIASNCIMTELKSSTSIPLNTVCRFIRNDEKSEEFKLDERNIYISCYDDSLNVNNYIEAKYENITYIVELNEYTRHSYRYIHMYLKVAGFLIHDIESIMNFNIPADYATRDYDHLDDIVDCLYAMHSLMMKV